MKYSYRWLKELSGTKKSAEQLAKLLMMHSFEVEGIEKFSYGLENIVVGKVQRITPHPNADRLRITEVQIGKDDARQIVCGAPNVAVGQMVAVALPGAKIPNGGMTIEETIIREVPSRGMICSMSELALGEDHTGILVLPDDAPLGFSFAKYLGLEDSIVEVNILPNRGADALAYYGLAREIAALDGHAPHFGEKASKSIKFPSYNHASKIIIADKTACLRYIGISFKDVTVGESPLWLKTKLLLSGLRPINVVVDITNYLMLLTGQPMHAFDADKISGTITIRRAKRNEKLKLLNGEIVKLSSEDLVIADDKAALALAGVMGGAASSVTDTTKNILLEVANFDGGTIRRTRIRQKLPTDASYRFERNLDPHLAAEAAREAATLFSTLIGAKVTGMRDVYPKKTQPWHIRLSLERVDGVLGTKTPLFEVVQYLALQGLVVKKVPNQKAFDVTVPTRRPDLRDEWDLIEEIGRMRGYEKITPVAPLLPLVPVEKNSEKAFEKSIKHYLADAGFDEVMTYSFYGDKEQAAARLPKEQHLELQNPLSPEQRWLRFSLVPLLLRKIRENQRHLGAFDCFEWGSVLSRGAKKREPIEKKMLLVVTVLKEQGTGGAAFFTLKGKIRAMLGALSIPNISFEAFSQTESIRWPYMHPTRSALVKANGSEVGIIGELHPLVGKSFGLDARVAVSEWDGARLQATQMEEAVFRPLPRFPYATRDISLIFPRTVTAAQVEVLLKEAGAPLLRECELFDIFEHNAEKNLAFHLRFGAPDRTLQSEEMDAVFDAIVVLAKERFTARLRD